MKAIIMSKFSSRPASAFSVGDLVLVPRRIVDVLKEHRWLVNFDLTDVISSDLYYYGLVKSVSWCGDYYLYKVDIAMGVGKWYNLQYAFKSDVLIFLCVPTDSFIYERTFGDITWKVGDVFYCIETDDQGENAYVVTDSIRGFTVGLDGDVVGVTCFGDICAYRIGDVLRTEADAEKALLKMNKKNKGQ